MRTGIVVLLIAVGVLVYLNPGMEEFKVFVGESAEEIILNEAGDSALGRVLSGAGGNLAGQYVDRITERDNYVVFSTYTIDLDGREAEEEHWRFLGIAGRFVELEHPPSAH